jgi:hypothetical protein
MSPYQMFLLTCWQDSERSNPAIWRFRLETPATGEQRGFASPDDLLLFLATLFADASDIRPVRE